MRPFDWSDNERLKNWLTFSVFLGVVIFVFIELSNVFVDTAEISENINELRAEERVMLANIDLLMKKMPTPKMTPAETVSVNPETP